MSHTASLDWQAIVTQADLRRLIEADLGPPARGGRWLCPFHDSPSTPNLSIGPDGRRWKCWSGRCGLSGDAIDWLVHRDGCTRVEAARKLSGDPSPRRRPQGAPGRPQGRPGAPARGNDAPAPATPQGSDADAWRDPAWQAEIDGVVGEAEQALWSPAGRAALDWLRSRGLDDHTVARFRLGFVPRSYRTVALGLHVARGVTIPWLAPGSWYSATPDPDGADPGPRWLGANVRRLGRPVGSPLRPRPDGSRSPKYLALRGSARGHLYPWPDVLPTQGRRPILLVEGELDALVGTQELGHVVHVATPGGASTRTLPRSARAALARCPAWLVATDRDDAGIEAALWWRRLDPAKARRVLLPIGKDLSEFVQQGGDPLGWLRSLAARS